MEKFLVTIEFRYNDAPRHEDDYTSRTKKVTIGVYDTFDEACKNGNDLLVGLESKFELHKFPAGHYADKERFSKNGGAFGSKKNLITDMAYLKTPFRFFAQIITLEYDEIDEVIDNVVNATTRYRKYKTTEE